MTDEQRIPPTYTLPAPLVADIYQLLAKVAAGQAARVFVALEDEIARQNDAAKAAENEPG